MPNTVVKRDGVPASRCDGKGLISVDTPGLNLRVIDIDGVAWFVAKDVCLSLGLDDTNKALTSLDADEKTYTKIVRVSMGTPKAAVINESGLYSLVMRSRKPVANAFKKWVTAEVLPTIRKTGGYMAPSVAVLAVEDLGCVNYPLH